MHSDPGLVQRLFEILPTELEPKKCSVGSVGWQYGVGVYKEFLIIRLGDAKYWMIMLNTYGNPLPTYSWLNKECTTIIAHHLRKSAL